MKLENGKTVEGDVLDMVSKYELLSTLEAWIICELAREVRELRRDVQRAHEAMRYN